MQHLQYSIYFLCSILYFVATHIDAMSMTTMVMFFFMFQYLYWITILHTFPKNMVVQSCPKCRKMTPQHFVHCERCKKCQPVDRMHFNIIGTCVKKSLYKRYIMFMRFYIALIALLTILQAVIIYYPFFLFVGLHVYVLKSTYDSDSRNIYVS